MPSETEDNTTIRLPALPCLELRTHEKRGRGGTLVHISPVLLFDHSEYNAHGQYTKLDDYTYKWPGGFALALGLGSMFNHEPFGHENIGFMRDVERGVIRYTALRDIAADEELCICYGSHVWFEVETRNAEAEVEETETDLLACFDL
ncbi:hypothetical protein DL89DRAFT_270083 [Linderina pennispora]|uniref:SET domain-containing protein n=1 Tax=Linderina pennispora TaxID=61395 RepID=A0A1Y1VZU2_9FUNG|nr:uncharacterized protein DL89DRAFT_270083 [Linderina pennispora]ORX66545.1 hypothetical protein DL89DRAFT_270083 [Linderina pennispora]